MDTISSVQIPLSPDALPPMEEAEGETAGDVTGEVAAEPRGKPLWRNLIEIALALTIVAGVFAFFFAGLTIDGDSMNPTLASGQRALFSRLPYQLTAPQRGDVVMVRDRVNPRLAKVYRVIGVPGDKLDVKGGQILLNGQPLVEPYVDPSQSVLSVSPTVTGRYQLSKDQYFVLNDNRLDTDDSRSFGSISSRDFIGRAWLVYWPLDSVAFIKHQPPTTFEGE
jgi:signal peptidase I